MIPGIVAHLWQSTLFAGVAWLMTLALRKNAAHVRYRILFIASIKFLIPFSLLVGLGTLAPRHAAAPRVQTGWVAAAEQIGQPLFAFPAAASRASVTSEGAPHSYIAVLSLVLWVFGFTAITVCWLVRWRRVHVLRKSAELVRMEFPVAVISADGLIEPGVFGIFRPVLLLPEGIEGLIDREQLDAILAHELCHVRRRDNLTSAMHMVVQAIFWFHPLVWWLGTRLTDERERACDEEVLRLGNKPQVYAAGILNVCKLYVETPLACVSGVTGADLKKRIEAIMKNRIARRLDFTRKAALAVAATAALAVPVVIGVMNAPAARAQSPSAGAATPRFDVASIKPSQPNAGCSIIEPLPGGGLHIECVPLKTILNWAYQVQLYQISGGPAWVTSENWTIVAKPDVSSAPATSAVAFEKMTDSQRVQFMDLTRERLQALLGSRFRLAIHRETVEQTVFALTVARDGPRLTASSDQSRSDFLRRGRGQITGVGARMETLVQYLGIELGRPVLDRTGLSSHYDFKLEWTPDRPAGSDSSSGKDEPANASGPTLFTAIQEQLGLRLETQKGPVEVLVIDHVERPSEN